MNMNCTDLQHPTLRPSGCGKNAMLGRRHASNTQPAKASTVPTNSQPNKYAAA